MDPNIEEEGTNRSGIYAVKVKLNMPILQILPVMGKIFKIQYPGIQTLCTDCFGHHNKRNCHSKKVPWTKYIIRFKLAHPNFPMGIGGHKPWRTL
jgi:hypothetical protein